MNNQAKLNYAIRAIKMIAATNEALQGPKMPAHGNLSANYRAARKYRKAYAVELMTMFPNGMLVLS